MTEEIKNESIEEEVKQTETETETETEVEAVVEPKKRGRQPKKVEQEQTKESVATSVDKIEEQDLNHIEAKKLGVYKLSEHVNLPKYATSGSACFDIRADLKTNFDKNEEYLTAYSRQNKKFTRRMAKDANDKLYVEIRPHERILIPTGLKFDIPEGYSIKVHPRSGTALKEGINLINQEGIIDSDYVDELFLPLVNSSESHVKIYHDERYAQGEVQQVLHFDFEVLEKAPLQKTERDGGFGHTGKN